MEVLARAIILAADFFTRLNHVGNRKRHLQLRFENGKSTFNLDQISGVKDPFYRTKAAKDGAIFGSVER